MRRLLALFAILCAVTCGMAVPAEATNTPPTPPAKCNELGPNGQLRTCFYGPDGQWQVSYSDPGGGMPGWFVPLAMLVVIGGIGFTAWKVSMARSMAVKAGLDPGTAAAVTLLSPDGLDATYIAANMRGPAVEKPAEAAPTRTVADRLRELQGLRDQDLLTVEEYESRRRTIVDSV